jgi:hypothetical protein
MLDILDHQFVLHYIIGVHWNDLGAVLGTVLGVYLSTIDPPGHSGASVWRRLDSAGQLPWLTKVTLTANNKLCCVNNHRGS